MKDSWFVKLVLLLAACLPMCTASPAQEQGCLDISNMAAMARAKTPAALKARKQKAGDSYRAQLIFAARMLEIDPESRSAAELLLNLLPKDLFGPEQGAWLDLLQLEKCPSGGLPDFDLKPLGLLQYHLPRLAAKGVVLVPEKMPEYVAYAFLSGSPDSDYAEQMQKVCRVRHKQFIDAVSRLSPRDKGWFVSKIFNPYVCRALLHPEQ